MKFLKWLLFGCWLRRSEAMFESVHKQQRFWHGIFSVRECQNLRQHPLNILLFVLIITTPFWFSWWPLDRYITHGYRVNSSPPRQDDRHFADGISKCIFMNERFCMLNQISLIFVPKGPVDNTPALVPVMAWHRTGDRPLPDSIMTRFIDVYMQHCGVGVGLLINRHRLRYWTFRGHTYPKYNRFTRSNDAVINNHYMSTHHCLTEKGVIKCHIWYVVVVGIHLK